MADRGLNHKENQAPHGARSGGLRLSFLLGVCVLTMFLMASAGASEGAGSGLRRQMELLGRGLVAVAVEDGVFLSWRLLGTEPMDLGFNVYRDGERLNDAPITAGTNFLDPAGTLESRYQVRAVRDGQELEPSREAAVWPQPYWEIPLQRPGGGLSPDGVSYAYHANDASVGDLDGDGEYEIVLKWDPTNAKDNAHDGFTGPVLIDAYKMDGTLLWRIDLGRNIRAGAHYTQFIVYDLDGDGRAEVALKTADGTVDGAGNVIGDPGADHRNASGRILSGPEYLTIFDGLTGRALVTVDYEPARGRVSDWGDTYGNRVDRFLAAVAYLDGERPSLITARGYYEKTMVVAWNYRDGELTKLWTFDSHDPERPQNRTYAGQGNHNLSVADVDGDGKDEIIYGAMALDDDGTGLHTTGLGHGDALHVSDLDPTRPGLEVFQPHESANSPYGISLRDAHTGEILWGVFAGADVGRAMAADIDPRYPGAEVWASNQLGMYSAQGEKISQAAPSINFGVWWDGDLLRELLDDIHIDKWDWEKGRPVRLLTAQGAASNNGTKATPSLSGDILGDWREEVIWRTADSSALRIYTATEPTEHRIYTLMHDPMYRVAIAWQNVAYNQPPHPSFFIGEGMEPPPPPQIYVAAGDRVGVRLARPAIQEALSGVSGELHVELKPADPAAEIDSIEVRFAGESVAEVDRLPATVRIDTRRFSEGAHPLEVVVKPEGGQPVSLWRQVLVDNVRPSISAASGGPLRDEALIRFRVDLSEGLAIESVRLTMSGEVLFEGAADSGEAALNTLLLEDGDYVLELEARTREGQSERAALEVTVQNLAVSVVQPAQRVVRGRTPLEVAVSKAEGLPLEEVRISVGGEVVYQGPEVPEAFELDTRRFPDGLHTIEAVARAGGRERRTAVERSFLNRWREIDHFQPPSDGWFGLVDRSKTSDESEGWTYATDDPKDFFGDVDRRVPPEGSEAYLVWEARGLESFRLTVYALEPEKAAASIGAAVSDDGLTWRPLPVRVFEDAASPSGWHRLILEGENADAAPSRLFRILVQPWGGPAESVQLGALELTGFLDPESTP